MIAAGSGIAVGVAGLALSTMPAGAEEDPTLPAIGAEELVASALEARPPAFEGVAEMQNELGIPATAGVDLLDFDQARVFHDGAESARVQVGRQSSELTLIQNPDEAWAYDSDDNTAQHFTWDDADAATAKKHAEAGRTEAGMADPSQAAAELIEQLRATSEITVDGTARVADRAAYELVLTPKPSEKTLLREITVAIDEETRLPLQVDVFANGTSDPVLSLGFVKFETGAQDADLFEFTPPEGAEVETSDAADALDKAEKHAGEQDAKSFDQHLTTVGDGWDTVMVGEGPSAGPADDPAAGAAAQDQDAQGQDLQGQDAGALLGQLGTPVSGEFGSGTYIGITVGGAIITDDGQVAAGAVPQQVLVDALDQE